jgi:hypothetical protein
LQIDAFLAALYTWESELFGGADSLRVSLSIHEKMEVDRTKKNHEARQGRLRTWKMPRTPAHAHACGPQHVPPTLFWHAGSYT